MSWQESFGRYLGPGALCGITLGDWLALLARSGFGVDPPYWLRAGLITAGSVQNSLFRVWERWQYDKAIRSTAPEPPLFVLGIWRSGTTHLHNLLSRDPRLAYPDFFEVFYPHTFLSTGWLNRPLLSRFIPDRRPQDNVRMAIDEPQEDEFALNCLTQLSWVLLWTLPRQASRYEKYLSFRDATPAEIARWQAALRWFVQKLAYAKGNRPLVLKSPAHTARVRMLLEVFPQARFIHIRRNPYDVFRSSLHSARSAIPWWTLQRPDLSKLEETTLEQYEEVYDAYFADRGLIPAGHLHELAYEDLAADPLPTLRTAYEALGLPDFAAAEPHFQAYLETIQGYKRNRFVEVASPWKEAIATRWRRFFEAWGYTL